MRILITGATGFIGRHLTKRLVENGHGVKCLVRDRHRAEILDSPEVSLLVGDLAWLRKQGDVLDDVDVVYHLAGVTKACSTREYYDGNYLATRNLIAICREHSGNLRRFVHVSSLAAVGPAHRGEPLTEDAGYHPVSHYGKSKMLGEIEVRKAADRFATTILRPVAVYGPADTGFLEYFRLVKKGLLPLAGWGERFLSVVYVDDLIDGIINAAENPKAIGQTYFLGDDEPYSVREIGSTIAYVMNSTPREIHLPSPFVYGYAAVSEIIGKVAHRPVLFNLQKAKEGVQRAWTCSVEKAKTELQFFPSTSLYDGMSRSYEWYCHNGWL